MVGYEDTDETLTCRHCGYKGKGWVKEHVRMTVESVETFYLCPKCHLAN